MGRTVKTLEDAARYRMLVVAKCSDCLREGKFMATDLAGVYGRHKQPKELHFHCSACGSKKVEVTLQEWGDIKQSEIVVWKPVNVKVPRE
jgi:Zn finger protein HypA/HybF involved in hydrogenase expression